MGVRLFLAAAFLVSLAACSSGAGGPTAPTQPLQSANAGALHTATFTLDNVALTFSSRLAAGSFDSSPAGANSQMAWASLRRPALLVDIEAVPYGFGSPLEHRLQSGPGIAASQRRAMAMLHENTAHVGQGDVSATLFGEKVSGAAYVDADPHASSGYRGTAHFVTEAGGRMWQINVSQELGANDAPAFMSSLRDLSLQSNNLAAATTMKHEELAPRALSRMQSPPSSSTPQSDAARVAESYTGWYVANPPGWWTQQPNTPCDYEHYWVNTPSSVPAAFQLYSGYQGVNNPWHGLVACGPNPYKYANADVYAQFYSGAWGVYEWECVELALRWMWEAYGVQPYSANGNSIASNYRSSDGGNVTYIANGGYPPLPVAGDVLQYSGGTYGHTSVVTYETHNSSGTGYLTVIEENNGNYAGNKLTETNWYVNCASDGSGCPTAWLHRP